MDRSQKSASQHSTAVRTAGSATLDILLPTASGERREPAVTSPARPTVHEAAILRQPQNGRRTRSEPQAHSAPHAYSGHRSPLSQTELESPCSGSPHLPVPAARCRYRKTQPRLEHRYYLHSHARWLSVFGRRDGLVQPIRAQLGIVQHDGYRFLPGGAQRRFALRPARDLELRSRLAVYGGRLPGTHPEAWHRHQHGRPRPCSRQRVHRTTVALSEIRVDLPWRLRHRPGTAPGTGELLPLLQSPTSAPSSGLSNAGRLVPEQNPKEKVIALMGALPPNPRDLPLLFPEWISSALLDTASAVKSKCLLGR